MIVRFGFGVLAAAMLAGCAVPTTMPSTAMQPAMGKAPMPSASGIVLQTLDVPIGQFPTALSTELTGIRKSLITAVYTEPEGATGGAIYNATSGTWTALKFPAAASTAPYGPDVTSSAYRVVGSYKAAGSSSDHGFLYDGSTNVYTTMDVPASFCGSKPCNETIAHSIYGDSSFKFVGNFNAVGGKPAASAETYPASGHAFLYDSKTKKFSKIDVPGATSTTAYGIWIDGTTVAVAGGYTKNKRVHAYVRNLGGKQLLTYDYPKAAITHFEGITGAGGAGNYNVIGDYSDLKHKTLVYGFFLPIRNWKPATPIVIGKVSANSVYERTVVGVYNSAGHVNGYITTVP